jgi:hypothetical protein
MRDRISLPQLIHTDLTGVVAQVGGHEGLQEVALLVGVALQEFLPVDLELAG